MQTEKRIHIALTEKAYKELEELKNEVGESHSTIIRCAIKQHHEKIFGKKDK